MSGCGGLGLRLWSSMQKVLGSGPARLSADFYAFLPLLLPLVMKSELEEFQVLTVM
jgi:hypothetical protein